MKKLTWIPVIAFLVLLIAGSVPAAPQDGEVMMAGFLLLRIRCPAAGYSVEQRAEQVNARAHELLQLGGFDLSTIKAVKSGNDALLYANGKVLVTVDHCTARANGMTPMQLANMWAERLRQIYPQVVPKQPSLQPTRGG